MKKILRTFSTAMATLLLAGCAGEEIKDYITFHVASTVNFQTTAARERINMPSTNFSLVANVDPFMYNNDLERVDVAKVNHPVEGTITGFYFKANSRGMKRLFTATATNLNNFIVAKLNGKPIAIRKVDMVISDGKIFMVADTNEGTDLQKIADEINESIEIAHRINE